LVDIAERRMASKPNGTFTMPAKTCKDLKVDYPNLTTGKNCGWVQCQRSCCSSNPTFFAHLTVCFKS
jgi:hypothetical protein